MYEDLKDKPEYARFLKFTPEELFFFFANIVLMLAIMGGFYAIYFYQG